MNNILKLKSNLTNINNSFSDIDIEVVGESTPTAVAFFDIDKTLAHLDILYKEAIHELFPNTDKDELIKTFIAGFKLGNSFREFDRMHYIYNEGKIEWIDPEVYIKQRLDIAKEQIDKNGNEEHERAANYLSYYGDVAAKIADRIYLENPSVFSKAKIGPIFALLEIYKINGILMFGFTANAQAFVKKLAMYLGLSDYFLDIATDEMMEGGGKEIAIRKLLNMLENTGLQIPKQQLIFVGDSIRGDVGSGALFCKNNLGYFGYGILVLENKGSLIEVRHLVNNDKYINSIINIIPTYGFVVDGVPLKPDGTPSLLARDMPKFLFKL